jgi:hypothetical protein
MPSTAQTTGSAAQAVNDMVAILRREYRSKGLRENVSGTLRFGLFGNLVGAEVAAEQRIEVGTVRNIQDTDEYVCVRHVLVVACSGFGCTAPLIEVATRDLVFDCDHGGITEESRLAARKQAQAHAEVCRALPRPTA